MKYQNTILTEPHKDPVTSGEDYRMGKTPKLIQKSWIYQRNM